MQQLEGYKYDIELDINMGYYKIYIFTHRRDMPMILAKSLKHSYNRILVGMCASGGIF